MPVSRFAIALAVAATLSVVFAVLAYRKREEPGARPLVFFHLAVAVGTAAYAMDVVSTSLSAQLLWVKLSMAGQAFTATAWLYVAIEYTGHERWASRRTAALIGLEPTVFTVGIFLPPVRETMFRISATDGTTGAIYHQGTVLEFPFFVHLLYLFLVALGGTMLFVQLFVRSRHLYRTQATAVLVAAIAPWTTVLAQSLGMAPNNDPSAFTWAVAGIALTAGLFRFKTLDPVPAAHESIVAEMGDGVVVLDDDDTIGDLNPAARELLSAGDDPVGRPVGEVFEDWGRVDYEGEGRGAWQELSLSVDGETRYVEVEVSPFTDRFDRVVGRLAVLRDVTERKRREQTLARYKTIFESVRDPVYVLDAEDRFVMVNRPFAALVGHDREALVGEPFETVLADRSAGADGGSGGGVDGRVPDAEAEGDVELAIRTADGQTLPCETRRAPIDFEGEAGGSVGFVRDISRRKRIQTELAETTERFETLVEASPLAILAVDAEGVVEVWNPAAADLFGHDREAVVGDQLPIVSEEHEPAVRERYERVLAGERITGFEVPLQRADGSLVETSVSVAPVHDADGEVYGMVAVVSDITDRKERERTLQRQNERLDEFASLVSHDLRNPLQVAAGNLRLGRETGEDEYLDDAETALDRMEELIDEGLSLARDGTDIGETGPVDLASAVRRAWDGVVTERGTLVVEDLPRTVRADETRLTELFENCFANAVDHAGPDVTVRVGWDDRAGGFYVADDGPGIPEGQAGEVFESGFTTDEDGTGFGLAIVRRIASAHGWDVSVSESEAGGARFSVTGVATTLPVDAGD